MATFNLATIPSVPLPSDVKMLTRVAKSTTKVSTGRSAGTVIHGDSSHGTYTARCL